MAYRSKFKGKEIDDRLDLVKELSEEIKDKQDNIEDLEDIRNGAIKGASALQTIPEEYVTETELEGKGYATVTQVNEKQDVIFDLDTIRTNSEKGANALQEIPSEYITESELNNKGFLTQHQDISHLATKSELTSKLNNKVDKVNGKQLSTEDFTTALKNKLESLSNYDDKALKEAVNKISNDLNTLIEGNATSAIESFNEIISFLEGVKDTEDLASIISSIEQQIANKIEKGTLSKVATSGSYNDLNDKPTIPSAVTESTVGGWGFTKNTGTVTGVKINGSTKNPSNGVVDLGTVITEHQDIAGIEGEITVNKLAQRLSFPSEDNPNPLATTQDLETKTDIVASQIFLELHTVTDDFQVFSHKRGYEEHNREVCQRLIENCFTDKTPNNEVFFVTINGLRDGVPYMETAILESQLSEIVRASFVKGSLSSPIAASIGILTIDAEVLRTYAESGDDLFYWKYTSTLVPSIDAIGSEGESDVYITEFTFEQIATNGTAIKVSPELVSAIYNKRIIVIPGKAGNYIATNTFSNPPFTTVNLRMQISTGVSIYDVTLGAKGSAPQTTQTIVSVTSLLSGKLNTINGASITGGKDMQLVSSISLNGKKYKPSNGAVDLGNIGGTGEQQQLKTIFGREIVGEGDVLPDYSMEITEGGTYTVESVGNPRLMRGGSIFPLIVDEFVQINAGPSLNVRISSDGTLTVSGAIGGIPTSYLASGVIPEEFMPKNVATLDDIQQADFGEDNEESKAYIKNRTHYFYPYTPEQQLIVDDTTIGTNIALITDYFKIGGVVYKSADMVGVEFNCQTAGADIYVSVVSDIDANGNIEYYLKHISGNSSWGLPVMFTPSGSVKTIDSAFIPEEYITKADFDNNIMTNITWSELVSKKYNHRLVAGAFYRITDYITTTTQENTGSAGNPFDVIVKALNKYTLSEEAYAIQSERDTDGYFANSNLAAWKLWYCLDNDTSRFAWADETSGTGVIYRMIDEFDNDCPYDFKNILFTRYELEAPDEYEATRNDTEWMVQLATNVRGMFDIKAPSFVWAGLQLGEYYWEYEFGEVFSQATSERKMFYTFSDITDFENKEITSDASLMASTYNNKIGYSKVGIVMSLPNNVFFGEDCYDNSFGNNCVNNSIGNWSYYNTFSHNCYSNTFGVDCCGNKLYHDCNYIIFSNSCYYNTFGISNYCNSFGDSCNANVFGKYSYCNSFGHLGRNNILGSNCGYNIFHNECIFNSFGDSCQINFLSISCSYNNFGNDCYENRFGVGYFYKYNTFGEAVQYLRLTNDEQGDYDNEVQNYSIANGIQGTYEEPLVINAERNRIYETTITRNSNGEIVQFCEGDNVGGKNIRLLESPTIDVLEPNKIYVYATNTLSSITINSFSTTDALTEEYVVQFRTFPLAESITLPSGVMWANGVIPTLEGDTLYELSVVKTHISGTDYFKAILTPFK